VGRVSVFRVRIDRTRWSRTRPRASSATSSPTTTSAWSSAALWPTIPLAVPLPSFSSSGASRCPPLFVVVFACLLVSVPVPRSAGHPAPLPHPAICDVGRAGCGTTDRSRGGMTSTNTAAGGGPTSTGKSPPWSPPWSPGDSPTCSPWGALWSTPPGRPSEAPPGRDLVTQCISCSARFGRQTHILLPPHRCPRQDPRRPPGRLAGHRRAQRCGCPGEPRPPPRRRRPGRAARGQPEGAQRPEGGSPTEADRREAQGGSAVRPAPPAKAKRLFPS
jgi:hypothetical protein